VSDIDTGVVDSLKALDPERPIREADVSLRLSPLERPRDTVRRSWTIEGALFCLFYKKTDTQETNDTRRPMASEYSGASGWPSMGLEPRALAASDRAHQSTYGGLVKGTRRRLASLRLPPHPTCNSGCAF
jgi:hypothetical protein